MPVPPLPYETLSAIINHCNSSESFDRACLLPLLLTSVTFKQIAEPLLHHSIHLYTPLKTIQFLRSITSRPHIAPLVYSCQSLVLPDESLASVQVLVRNFLEQATNLRSLLILGGGSSGASSIGTLNLSPTALPYLSTLGASLPLLSSLVPTRPISHIILSASSAAHESYKTLSYLSSLRQSASSIETVTLTSAEGQDLTLAAAVYVTSLFLKDVKHIILQFDPPPPFARVRPSSLLLLSFLALTKGK
jgi:hypothetical protein